MTTMRVRFSLLATLAVLACALVVAACGGGDDGGSAGGGQTGSTEGAKSIKASAMNNAKGNITYCSGKDTSGDLKEGIKNFNALKNGITVKLLEFPEAAQEQRNQFIQRQRAKSGECDAFESDVVWTAEFANQKWLTDMTDYVNSRKDEFIPSTLSSVNFDGKTWGVPRVTDTGFIYYRTDAVKQEPKTWQDLYEMAKTSDPKGFVYQGAAYEGLAVHFLELAYAAGGKVLSADGKSSEINSPTNEKVLQFMVDGIKSGAVPKAVTTYTEEPARRAFEAGRASFERQWPYAYALGKQSKIANKFKVMAFPTWEGGKSASILGGHNMVISTYSKNPGATLKFIDYMTSAAVMKSNAVKYSKAPVLKATYEDAAVKKAIPFSEQLKAGVERGQSRPVSPVYQLIVEAIYDNVNAALSGSAAPKAALEKADADIKKALATF
jgi:multiple sugar transport system substrate-binding protein